MKYRRLGNTGVIVSEVALGTMQFGGRMNMGNLGQEATTKMVKLALDRGINFIDTADVYSLGESETLLGNALKGVREEIVLATKVRLPMSENFNRSGATRVNIMRGIESSLKRMAATRRIAPRCRPIWRNRFRISGRRSKDIAFRFWGWKATRLTI